MSWIAIQRSPDEGEIAGPRKSNYLMSPPPGHYYYYFILFLSLTGSSVGLGPCITKDGGPRFEPPGGTLGIPQYIGEAYPVGSPEPQGDYGDA